MAKNKQGIMGPTSGKVGVVVTYQWKGREVMRVRPAKMTNPKTPAQQLHRAKFKAVNALASDLQQLIKRGFRQMAEKQSSTETGLFVKHNWPIVEAVSVDDINIPLDRMVISMGELPGVEFGVPQTSVDGQQATVSVPFTTADEDEVLKDDYVYLGIYCPERRISVLSAPAKRMDEVVQVKVPGAIRGEELHLYGFAVGSDFNPLHKDEASASRHLGTVTV